MFDRDEQEISQIIDNGLEAIRAGRATLEQVLEQQEQLGQHPQEAEAIRGELEAGLWLVAQQKEVDARPGFVSASRKRVLERIQAEARSQGTKHAFFGFVWPRRITFQWVVAALVLIVVLTGAGGVVKASQAALPGDNLYAVKRASEQVAYSVTLSEVKRVELSQQFADKRLGETEQLVADRRYTDANQTLAEFEQQVHQAVAQLEKVDNAQAQVKRAAAEKLKTDLSKNNDRLTNLSASAPPVMLGKLQDAMAVTTTSAAATEHLIDSLPAVNDTPTPTVTVTLTPTDMSTATPEDINTPEQDETPVPAGVHTPSSGPSSGDTIAPLADDSSPTPKPSHTPKVKTNNGNDSNSTNNKNSGNNNSPNPPDKPTKAPPPGKKK